MSQDINVISVDVGTTSVRLAVINFHGQDLRQAKVLASHDKNINHFQDGDRYEQNGEEIFTAICECCKICIQEANVSSNSIKSIGFSATCSLVIHDAENSSNNVIMWMDHRAVDEAQLITLSDSDVLKQFGGICSPEFSLAKLMWLKNNAYDRLSAADGLFELPDWLVYRCINDDPSSCPRSQCSLTCKWGYDAKVGGHSDVLDGLFDSGIKKKFGSRVMKPGTVSGYVSLDAAIELGLVDKNSKQLHVDAKTDVVVGTSLIDAHAGMVAMLSIPMSVHDIDLTVETTFCSLAGTSSCHMLLSKEYNFTRGVWGPYKDVVLDGFYLLEAGQSLTGKLIEICIHESHEGRKMLDSGMTMKEIIQHLNESILASDPENGLHILPTYHGNRSPLANARLRGGIYGLTTRGLSLLDSYVAHIEAIAFETKFIVETLGIQLKCILVSGGLMKNTFYMQTLANILECKALTISLQEIDVMVMGSALVARCAAQNSLRIPRDDTPLDRVEQQPLTEESIKNLIYDNLNVRTFSPKTERKEYLEKKYSCYKEFVQFSQKVDNILNEKDN